MSTPYQVIILILRILMEKLILLSRNSKCELFLLRMD